MKFLEETKQNKTKQKHTNGNFLAFSSENPEVCDIMRKRTDSAERATNVDMTGAETG